MTFRQVTQLKTAENCICLKGRTQTHTLINSSLPSQTISGSEDLDQCPNGVTYYTTRVKSYHATNNHCLNDTDLLYSYLHVLSDRESLAKVNDLPWLRRNDIYSLFSL